MDRREFVVSGLVATAVGAISGVASAAGAGTQKSGHSEPKEELTAQSEYIERRNVVFESTGHVLNPGKSMSSRFRLGPCDHKVKRSVRVKGAAILPEKLGKRSENTFRKYCRYIDDYLDPVDVFREQYSLVFVGENAAFERNAFYRLSHGQLESFMGNKVQVNFPVKRQIESFGPEGFFKLRLQLYVKKEGRALDDIFDDADEIWELDVLAGNSDWAVTTKELDIPRDIACILVQISCRDMAGVCKVGTPSFKMQDAELPFYPLQPYIDNHENWIGENLSSKEWPEFELAINGRPFYTGKIFDRASEMGEFQLDLPELPTGQHELSVKLLDGFPARLPFLLSTIEIHEMSARNFEVIFTPEFVSEKSKFGILIEVNKPGITLTTSGDEHIEPLLGEKQFAKAGLYSLVFNAGEASRNQKIKISDGTNERVCNIGQIIKKKDDGVHLSDGDDIYISRSTAQFARYLKWYMREGIGNSYCWRPSYQWSGARGADPEFYSWAVGLLQELQMPYAHMVEGRTLPGRNINPSLDIMDSPFFMGRQSHENDGCFYYWDQFVWEGLYSDLAAKFRPYGGIFAKVRPIRTDRGNFVFFDPYGVKDMADGARTFVGHLSKAKGQSIRNTGPSTLFRYFFQAGYEWVGAEQMYGPDELIMSSLRGASRANGKKHFGTHLATQWGTHPFNDTDHPRRLFLSLAVSYIHGATHINTEDGLWNMEEGIDRFSAAGKAHIERQRALLRYVQTHERRGNLVAPIAILQGRNDAWKCFDFRVKSNVWGQRGEEWKYGAPEESFDLMKSFYPNSVLGEITLRANDPRAPKGFYTATPYGLVDLIPIEAPQDVLDNYEAIAFLGWNTFQQDDFERLLSFVRKGKTLLLTGNHANTELDRNRPTQYPVDDRVLIELLGKDYKHREKPYRHRVGQGEVIFYPQKLYPAESPVRNEYVHDLKKIRENAALNQMHKGWMEGAENIEFAVWDWDDSKHRTIYLLNIDWWSTNTSHPATLAIGDARFPLDVRRDVLETVTVFQDVAVLPQTMTTDVLGISRNDVGYEITIQTTGKERINVFHKPAGKKVYSIAGAGIHKITV
jgi:hypothetical protein